MQRTAHQIYSFDEFRLDLTRGCLFRGTLEINLRPKSFELLKYLTENHGRLVSKNELIQAVWNETAVTDDSLVQCLKDIRNALGDDAQQIIKTVPRRGYIFEKEVTENGGSVYTEETSGVHLVIEETFEREEQNLLAASPLRRVSVSSFIGAIKRHKIVSAVGLSVLVIAVIAGIAFYRPVLAWWFRPPSIAVLPIVNATGDTQQDYISDGLTESIITSLARLNAQGKTPRLRVIAPNTMFMFKNKEVEARSVGRELGADSILASKMFFQNGLRIFKFELINASDGSVMWSNQYSVEPTSPVRFLETQDQIPSDVAARLSLGLSDADRANLTRRYTQLPEAYDLYLKGRAEYRKITPSSLKKSIELFQQAIDLDENFATAYWAMGISYRHQGEIDERPDREADDNAIDSFQKALKIDNNLAPAQIALKQIESNWDWKAIEKEGPTHPRWGSYLSATGKIEENVELEKKQLSATPHHPVLNFRLCRTLVLAGHPDEAVAQCNKTLNLVSAPDKAYLGPESPWIHLFLGLAYSKKEMYAEAETEMKLAVDLGENSKTLLAELGVIYAKSGQGEKAQEILDGLRERANRGEYAPALNIAKIYTVLGDKDQAFAWLNKAIDEREGRTVAIIRNDLWDPLRDDPRFADLLRRMNLPL